MPNCPHLRDQPLISLGYHIGQDNSAFDSSSKSLYLDKDVVKGSMEKAPRKKAKAETPFGQLGLPAFPFGFQTHKHGLLGR